MPLIYVNAGFLKMTGYNKQEVLGRNCRFLQCNDNDQPSVTVLRGAIERKQAALELLNYRKSGEPFWNKLSMTPIFDDHGALIYFIGVQNDVTMEKEKELLERTVERHKLITETTIEAQEKERKYIEAELHDNINQMLASAKLYLNIEQRMMRLD